jgi:hypothetical protein
MLEVAEVIADEILERHWLIPRDGFPGELVEIVRGSL